MLTYLASLITVLAAVPYCPPESGQLRWDLRFEFNADRTYAARSSVWDRDQSGAPSKGDILRIEAAWIQGTPLPFEESWAVLGDALAQDVASAVAGGKATVACESTLSIREEPPVMGTAAQLARHLDQLSKPVLAELAEVQRMNEAMGKWAQEICKKTKYIAVLDLSEALYVKAAKPFGVLGEAKVRDAADAAARDRSVTCTRLSQGNISFD